MTVPIASLHIFSVGTWTPTSGQPLTFSAADLAATAAAYDPAKHEAPLVVGHPATDDPAYGWVDSLVARGPDLEAVPREVDPEFAAMVNAERFNRISSSFFLPDSPENPVPGVYYLRHVGFLGAAAPAVRGLRKPTFALASDAAGIVTVEFSLSPPETNPVSDSTQQPDGAGTSADFAARAGALEAENARLKAEVEARVAELAAEKARQERATFAAFAEKLVQDGRVLPRDREGLVEFMSRMPAAQALEFAAADGQTVRVGSRAWLEDFLKRLPVQVDYAERSAGTGAPPPVGDDRHRASFAASPDLQAEFGDVETYLAWQKAHASGRVTILRSKVK